ncbi:MAG TPA: LysR substrate-binding domain-containing protein [Roseiarcus sp.]|nr:LysR substrate-binding domain-containing protein [Roseiarcus sp.]
MRSFSVRLPSLDLVRGFVAVGRRMSMTLAAEDLFLTQSAVSRQIIALETALGARLINRGYRSISFTAEGERFFRIADSALQQLQDAVNALAAGSGRAPVTITASIGVSGLWLMPRLGGFQSRHPDIDVRVAANNKIIDLRTQGADIAIRYCAAANAPPGSLRLFGEAVAPVAHPSLCVNRLDAEAIATHVLIEYDHANRPWLQWADRLHSMGLSSVKPRGVLRYNQYDQAIRAALEGQGIALGRIALIEPLLTEGRLVAAGGADPDHSRGYAYWLVQAEEAPRDDVQVVIDWIKAEARSVESRLENKPKSVFAAAESKAKAPAIRRRSSPRAHR